MADLVPFAQCAHESEIRNAYKMKMSNSESHCFTPNQLIEGTVEPLKIKESHWALIAGIDLIIHYHSF
jgi:hypothetical protein